MSLETGGGTLDIGRWTLDTEWGKEGTGVKAEMNGE